MLVVLSMYDIVRTYVAWVRGGGLGEKKERKKGNICINTVTIILTERTQSTVLIGHVLLWNVLDENESP